MRGDVMTAPHRNEVVLAGSRDHLILLGLLYVEQRLEAAARKAQSASNEKNGVSIRNRRLFTHDLLRPRHDVLHDITKPFPVVGHDHAPVGRGLARAPVPH